MPTKIPANIPVFVTANGKKSHAGDINLTKRIWRKEAIASKHMLRTPPGWAYDITAYEEHRDQFDALLIHDKESGKTYTCSAQEADFHLRMQEHRAVDRGYGRQFYIPLKDWAIDSPAQQAA